MSNKRHTPEEVRALLVRAQRLHDEGRTWQEAAFTLGISAATLHRWRRQFERKSSLIPDHLTPELSNAELLSLTKPFGNIAAVKCRNIVGRVRHLAERCFSKSIPLRPQSVENPLSKATKGLRKSLADLDGLTDGTWRFVELSQAGDWQASEQRRELVSLINRLEAAGKTIREYVRINKQDQGGPLPDGRLSAFINGLWVVYYEESGELPKHKTDQEGIPLSRYNQFVQEAVRLFYPLDVPWSSVRETMRVSTLGELEKL